MQPSLLLLSFLTSTALSSPTPVKRSNASMCGQWDSVVTGTYTLYNNLWDESAADSGSQCTTLTSPSSNTLAWSTSWSWSGASSSVKSFANVVYTQDTGVELSTISSIPSVFKYKYSGSDIVADGECFLILASQSSSMKSFESFLIIQQQLHLYLRNC